MSMEPEGERGKRPQPTDQRWPAEKPVPSDIYPVIDNDLARDNLENDLSAADLQDM